MNTTITQSMEHDLLTLTAQAIDFDYIMYVPMLYHLRGGLLHLTSSNRTAIWNPLTDDAHLLQLAVASPTVDLQSIIAAASKIDGDNAARCKYVRETFVRAVTKGVPAMTKTTSDTITVMHAP